MGHGRTSRCVAAGELTGRQPEPLTLLFSLAEPRRNRSMILCLHVSDGRLSSSISSPFVRRSASQRIALSRTFHSPESLILGPFESLRTNATASAIAAHGQFVVIPSGTPY
jgi:hypothetical protein